MELKNGTHLSLENWKLNENSISWPKNEGRNEYFEIKKGNRHLSQIVKGD
jgi:hypothetical protein